MKALYFVPASLKAAGAGLREALTKPPANLSTADFVRQWATIAYLFPGLHPDEFDNMAGGWPRPLRQFAAEASRRTDAGELGEDALYPADAQWAGLYDRLAYPTSDGALRRSEIAARSAADG